MKEKKKKRYSGIFIFVLNTRENITTALKNITAHAKEEYGVLIELKNNHIGERHMYGQDNKLGYYVHVYMQYIPDENTQQKKDENTQQKNPLQRLSALLLATHYILGINIQRVFHNEYHFQSFNQFNK